MRWCILPVHTHSQIRLDLTIKTQNPRGRCFDGRPAVKLVFSPRSKQFTVDRITDKHTQKKTKPRIAFSRDVTRSTSVRRDSRPRSTHDKIKDALVRACNPARSHISHTRDAFLLPYSYGNASHLTPLRHAHAHSTLTLATLATHSVHTRFTHLITHATDM